MGKKRVLVVDDEPGIRFAVRNFLELQGYLVEEADTCDRALQGFRRARPDVVVLDHILPDGTALDLMPRLRELYGRVPIIILTGHGSIDLAVRTVKEGAEQFLTKPVELPALLTLLERAVENQQNRQRSLARANRLRRNTVDPFRGNSQPMREIESVAKRIVTTDDPVLITGETGTGKGVLARWLHAYGPRTDDAFVHLNCAGLPTELLESELFGHARGAFTSAIKEKTGLLEVAHGGTLFLDEVSEMDAQVQAKLLTVIEEQRFRKRGGVHDRVVDIRFIAATNRDLKESVRQGSFRGDLYFRINTIQLTVPPLRERGEDIAQLANSFLTDLASDLGRGEIELQEDALDALQRYPWPGNIRELRNVLERAILLTDGNTLSRDDLRFESYEGAASQEPRGTMTLRDLEIRHIARVMKAVNGRVPLAATCLGVPKSSLYQKLKNYRLEPSTFRKNGAAVG